MNLKLFLAMTLTCIFLAATADAAEMFKFDNNTCNSSEMYAVPYHPECSFTIAGVDDEKGDHGYFGRFEVAIETKLSDSEQVNVTSLIVHLFMNSVELIFREGNDIRHKLILSELKRKVPDIRMIFVFGDKGELTGRSAIFIGNRDLNIVSNPLPEPVEIVAGKFAKHLFGVKYIEDLSFEILINLKDFNISIPRYHGDNYMLLKCSSPRSEKVDEDKRSEVFFRILGLPEQDETGPSALVY